MFSPLASPNGVILYALSTTLAPEAHLDLSPYETFRAPLLVWGIADAEEEGCAPETLARLDDLLATFTKSSSSAVASHLLVFDAPVVASTDLPNVSFIPSVAEAKSTTIKTIFCDLSATFLANLTTLARKIQDSHFIDTPSSETYQSRLSGQSRNGHDTDALAALQEGTNGFHAGDADSLASDSHPSSPIPDSQSPTSLSAPAPLERPQSASRFSPFRRDSSRDRRSTPVVPVTVTERARSKLKARQSVILGTLFLHAGRWHDALRELTDGATRAKSISDHVWHAKALENILCTMMLMAWAGVDFSPPPLCYSGSDKPQARPRAMTGGKDANEIASEVQDKGLRTLTGLIPDLARMICDVYPRAAHFQGESLAPFALSQSIVRLSYLLAVMYRFGGALTVEAMHLLVSGSTRALPPITASSGLVSRITKQDMTALLFRAYPSQNLDDSRSSLDVAIIMSGMSSVLAFAGLRRKQGLLVKDLVSMLIPGLIQARKVGAAEVGIHPAASLAALHGLNNDTDSDYASVASGDLEAGFHALLLNLIQIYAAPSSLMTSHDHHNGDSNGQGERQRRIMLQVEAKAFGSPNLKSDILRLCSNFSEALPNFRDVVQFAGCLLDTAGPRGIRRPTSAAQSVRLSREEQYRISSKITRTLGVVRASDVSKLETEYWDPFLVRGITLSGASDTDLIASHAPDALLPHRDIEESKDPLLPKPRDATVEEVAVLGDKSRFLVTLQNPFEFEVIVERFTLSYKGISLQQNPQSLVLGPARSQTFTAVAVASEAGQVQIDGCIVKIQGCREQFFPIYKASWTPKLSKKMKTLGLSSNPVGSRDSTGSFGPDAIASPDLVGPVAETVAIKVIDPLPLLAAGSDSLSQSIITVLEGQRRTFGVTVRNVSESIPVTFVKVSFSHALRESRMETSKGILGRTELHELDHLQLHQQPFTCKQSTGVKCLIKPGELYSFQVEVLGRIGITGGTVIIDYTQWDPSVPADATSPPKSRIYTRMLGIPFSVTVQPSISLQRVDVMPLLKPLPQSHHLSSAHTAPSASTADLVSYVEKSTSPLPSSSVRQTSFLLLLDLKNASDEPLSASISVSADPSSPESQLWTLSHTSPYTSSLTIQPSRVVRIVVPLPQLLVTDPTKAVPALKTMRERQFVVSASGGPSPAAERATLELFWYRQALLSLVSGHWQSMDGLDMEGSIDVRGIQLNSAMLDVVRLHAIHISFSLDAPPAPDEAASELKDGGESEQVHGQDFSLQTMRFATLTAHLCNVSAAPVTCRLVLRPQLQHGTAFDAATIPAASSGTGNAAKATDVDAVEAAAKNFVWSGSLQKAVVALQPGAKTTHRVGICVTSSGRYGVEGCVTELVRQRGGVDGAEESKVLGRGRCELVVKD